MADQAIMYPIRFVSGFDGEVYEVDWRDWSELCQRDIHARSIPSDPNCLMLTADDCAWLWHIGIGTGEA
jgi:hypothetical protein